MNTYAIIINASMNGSDRCRLVLRAGGILLTGTGVALTDRDGNIVGLEVLNASYTVSHSVTMILADNATTKKLFQGIKQLHITFMLNNCKFR